MKLLKNKRGFTLVEMLIVLVIVSVLSLLIIPNVMSTRSNIDEEGKYALNQLVHTQMNLYNFEDDHSGEVDLEMLFQGKYITQKQMDQAAEWGIPFK